MQYQPGLESIGRVDVACDILAPDFEANRDQIVAHAQTTVSELSKDLMQVVGRPGRVETITVGKNPQRQVVLYDKRAEALVHRRVYWWPVWDAALEEQGLPLLDKSDRSKSAVWRVELRAFKRHLKDTWHVSTWGDLRETLPEILRTTMQDVRYCQPSSDSNRARWRNHEIWDLARHAFNQDMEELSSMVDRAKLDLLIFNTTDDFLHNQIAALLVARAGLNAVPHHDLARFAASTLDTIAKDWKASPAKTLAKLNKARIKYIGSAT